MKAVLKIGKHRIDISKYKDLFEVLCDMCIEVTDEDFVLLQNPNSIFMTSYPNGEEIKLNIDNVKIGSEE